MKINFFQIIGLLGQLQIALGQLVSGQPVAFRTYIAGKHIEVSVTELPS
jgi:hypothetical protein